MYIDYGALWAGCFAPFLHQTVNADQFLALFEDFPVEAFKHYFNPGLTRNSVFEEDYVRFMTWFGMGYDDAWGPGGCNVGTYSRSD